MLAGQPLFPKGKPVPPEKIVQYTANEVVTLRCQLQESPQLMFYDNF